MKLSAMELVAMDELTANIIGAPKKIVRSSSRALCFVDIVLKKNEALKKLESAVPSKHLTIKLTHLNSMIAETIFEFL